MSSNDYIPGALTSLLGLGEVPKKSKREKRNIPEADAEESVASALFEKSTSSNKVATFCRYISSINKH